MNVSLYKDIPTPIQNPQYVLQIEKLLIFLINGEDHHSLLLRTIQFLGYVLPDGSEYIHMEVWNPQTMAMFLLWWPIQLFVEHLYPSYLDYYQLNRF